MVSFIHALFSNTLYAQTRSNVCQAADNFPYIDWAIENNFGVIDVNFPKEVPKGNVEPFLENSSEQDIQAQFQELLSYLWDNHLQINPNAPIILLGVGDAYLGIRQLLTSRGKFSTPLSLRDSL